MKKSMVKKPLRSTQVPANARMLDEMEQRLIHRMDSGFSKVDSRFNEMESRFSSIDSRFNEIDSRFSKVDSALHKMSSEIHRIALFVEEQNARNKFVMDGYAQIYELLTNRS